MTQQEFIDKISQQYQKSGDLLEGNGGYDILRGTAHTVSGYMEDVFALYMASRINSNTYQYLVDKLISYRGEKGDKAIRFKPDLAILDKSVLMHYFDLKTNLGWIRDLKSFLKEKDELIQKIKGGKAWISFPYVNSDNPEIVQDILISERLKYKIVVYDGWNISRNQLAENISFASTLDNVELFVLKLWNESTKEFTINQKAFDALY
ncbi:hypothetical protein [Sunxiuqinia elliptica]|uniref:Uncharacterized protein n=1 Tax=Sunxiuqinia elliptica TaxID=655355 RepID=A0A4R6HA94_9BACT|nr:hypothetical protein [Sunxiuqinia elliptica]TDO05433.1 hypothetical protein DET52_101793 [Sunxiuqinia elliptica]TDO64979.1 hypothetical protein DET65_1352 [Sunxiuqinia elliptica]